MPCPAISTVHAVLDYPLTISDFASRYLLACEALTAHARALRLCGVRTRLPGLRATAAIRTDNGVPFASADALYGLSKLAVWWLRLGIRLQRNAPGKAVRPVTLTR